jgi:dephospho-CoA kinase
MTLPMVGLTGGIASGKSTVARAFKALGVPVVDADLLAREVVEPGSEGLSEIVRVFGADVLNADGTLHRKALGARVFADAGLRAQLNAITHPRIAMAASQRMQELARLQVPYAIYEAALLVENGMHRAMQALVVVAIDEATQLARLKLRDGLSDEEACARIAAQASLAHKLAAAHFVIDNGAERERTIARVSEVHRALLSQLNARTS